MKKSHAMDDDLRPEYDMRQLLKGSVRGKHYKEMQAGYIITIHKADGTTEVKEVSPPMPMVILEPDVYKYFPDSASVNETLRALIRLVPQKRQKIMPKTRVVNDRRKAAVH